MARKAVLGRVSDVDIRLLRVFRSVVACGGVSAAELELNIGRSTISRHLSDLELRLGVKLCNRGPGGFGLTPEGEQVHEASTRLLAAISSFQTSVDDVHQRLTGHLSIAHFDKSASNPKAKLPETIRRFEEIAPEVTLEIHMEPVNLIETGILSGSYHLGIVPIHRRSTSIDYFTLYPEQMYLFCGKEHPLFHREDRDLSADEILEHKYAGIGFHSPNMMISHLLNFKRSADVYDEEAIATLILSGQYLGFLPDHYATPFVARGQMRQLCPDRYNYQSNHAAIVRRSPAPSRLVQTFMTCLRQAHGEAARPTDVPV